MLITIKLFPPLGFPDGRECREVDVPENTTIADFLKSLEQTGALGDYSWEEVFAIVEKEVASNDYILQAGQTVKIILHPVGG